MADGVTIGAVIDRLAPEFPDISISKVRFLESKGLLAPQRRPSGYRTYCEADIERLAYVLRAQRDWFWPLRVIREALDAIDRGLTPPTPQTARPVVPIPLTTGPSAAELAAPGPAVRLTAREVGEAAGLDGATVEGMTAYGLLRPDAAGHLTSDDLAVAHAVAALVGYGIEPRHLRSFRTAADRELGLVEQVLATSRRSEQDDAATVLAACVALHAALVRRGLHSSLAPR